jgi:pimeloyl-ACP methyl ester carboxylesterase
MKINAAADEGVASLAHTIACQLEAKVEARLRHQRASSSRRPIPTVLIGHNLGGLEAAYAAEFLPLTNLEVRGVIALATPFGGSELLRWALSRVPTLCRALGLLQGVGPELNVDAPVAGAIARAARQRHAQPKDTSHPQLEYRCLTGWADPMVRPRSAFSAPLSACSVLLWGEGHYSVAISDRALGTVVRWCHDMLGTHAPRDVNNMRKPD